MLCNFPISFRSVYFLTPEIFPSVYRLFYLILSILLPPRYLGRDERQGELLGYYSTLIKA